tara:strand:- start:12527 stop:13447 length:921 start_codon:yes stop_codon:yes gene_type:complete
MMRTGLGTPISAWQRLRSASWARSPGFLSSLPLGSVLGPMPIGGRIGNLEVRLAETPGELRKAQALRYQVFYREMDAVADARTRFLRRDEDRFDRICDHLLVLDHQSLDRRKQPRIVGTYRVLRQEVADAHGGFYSASEYDIEPLLRLHSHQKFLELGRSCVLPDYRTTRTVELLWHGVWSYVLAHQIDVLFGCASFAGTEPDDNAVALSFLYHHATAAPQWTVKALPGRYTDMNRLPMDKVPMKTALRNLPPLIKGYLRVGAKIGEGAVLDHQFGTTDILIILPVPEIDERYIRHYGADAARYAV